MFKGPTERFRVESSLAQSDISRYASPSRWEVVTWEIKELRMSQKELLLTAGYAGHSLDSFLAKLMAHEVRVVVDVRQNPVSRKKGFSGSKLSTFLEANAIEYVHESQLGVPVDLRKQLKAGAQSLAAYFEGFRDYLARRGDVLDRLYDLAITKRCCLICLENRPAECHRHIVAEAVEARNGHRLKVVHV